MFQSAWPARRQLVVVTLVLILFAPLVSAQNQTVNYTTYYRYPLSFGVESQALIPFSRYRPLGVEAPYGIVEVSGSVRWPLPPLPLLQPTLRFGVISFDRSDRSAADTMDHTDLYVSGGLTAALKLSKLFEIGAELLAGYDYSLYPNISPGSTLSNSSLIVDGGLKLTINPIFNVSVELHPSLRYLYSPGALTDFNGPAFAVGGLVNLRLGRDPDAGASTIRAIRFERLQVQPVFAAMQSWYVKNPMGSVTLRNAEKAAITDVEVSFWQAGYMDSPTRCVSIPELASAASADLDLLAAYNQEVFFTVGVTPLNGEIVVSYRYRGQAVEQRQSVAYELHDKTALTWDDDRKVAAFITQRDPVVRDYASWVRQCSKELVIGELSASLQTAMQLYGALGVMGCLYQADPAAPFASMQESKVVVDSISLARDTLARITGDCDDLTVLYCSLLESVGVESAFVTAPGHIYAAVNTKVKARDYGKVHPDRGMTITVGDELWVPVEITLVGRGGFLEAWRAGVEEWEAWDKEPKKRGLYVVRQAQEIYRSVALKETTASVPTGDPAKVAGTFQESLGRLMDALLRPYLERVKGAGAGAADWNKLGIRYAQYGRLADAEQCFRQALKLDRRYQNASTNLGNVYFLRADYAGALDVYTEALAALEREQRTESAEYVRLLVNVSKSYHGMEKWAEAKQYYERAARLSPEAVAAYAYLGSSGQEGSRAGEQGEAARRILYLGEE